MLYLMLYLATICAVFHSPEAVDIAEFTAEDVEGFYLIEDSGHTLLFRDE